MNRNTSISIDDITGEKETPKYYRGLKAIRELAGKNKDMIDLMQIRDSENMDMFRSFVHFGLQHIKSKIDWQYERQDVTISNFFSVYDESFIILLMMNSWKEFEMMARGERIPRGDRKTLFTNCIVDETDISSDSSTNGNRGAGTNHDTIPEDTEEDDLNFALPYFPIFTTLLAFSKYNTIGNIHTARIPATDSSAISWSKNIHNTHLLHKI